MRATFLWPSLGNFWHPSTAASSRRFYRRQKPSRRLCPPRIPHLWASVQVTNKKYTAPLESIQSDIPHAIRISCDNLHAPHTLPVPPSSNWHISKPLIISLSIPLDRLSPDQPKWFHFDRSSNVPPRSGERFDYDSRSFPAPHAPISLLPHV